VAGPKWGGPQKEENWGATPCQKEVVGPPHFWPSGGWSHPHGQSGGGRTIPMAKGVVRPPPKGQKKKKILSFWLGWLRPPPIVGMGVTEATPSPWWWSGHLQKPKTLFFSFFFWPFGGGRTTTLAMEGGSTTSRPAVEATPFWPRRWLRFSSFFLSFFFFKKIIIILMAKRMSF
jgi:hypothetical protein